MKKLDINKVPPISDFIDPLEEVFKSHYLKEEELDKIKYNGYEVPKHISLHSFQDKLSDEYLQDHDVFRELLITAFQLGGEQMKRIIFKKLKDLILVGIIKLLDMKKIEKWWKDNIIDIL